MKPRSDRPVVRACLALAALVTLAQCGDPGPAAPGPVDTSFVLADAGRTLRDATSAVSLLNTAIRRFLSDPDEETRASAVDALYLAHDAWLEAWAGAAVLSGESMSAHAYSIDAWPVTPGFLDTLPEYPQSGMVADVTLPLNASSVRRQHGFSDDSEVAMGFHAIWHLLTDRTVDDFIGSDELTTRRRLLLGLQAELLFADLHTIGNASRRETVTLPALMSASIDTLEQALALARAAERGTPHLSRTGPAAASRRIAQPITIWLSHEAVRRRLAVAHPALRDRLAETLRVLNATDTPEISVSDVGANNDSPPDADRPVGRVDDAGAADPVGYSPVAPSDAGTETDATDPEQSRLALALRASIQVLNDVVRAERALSGVP
ncbi:MAG: hypothetical protein CMQ24_07575 [Gammaproteobacteria bacterium]|nr:hypothetical protein [Gammaproteobacteria bacterium]